MKKIIFIVVMGMLLTLVSCDSNHPTSSTPVNDLHYDLVKVPYEQLDEQSSSLYNTITSTPADSNGVQMFEYGGQLYYHPVQIAHRIRQAISDYKLTGDAKYLNHAIESAETLRQHAHREDNCIYFPYEFTFSFNYITYQKPFYSGMAQGMLLSVYTRLYYLTKNELYHAVADSILNTMDDFDNPHRTVFISTNDGLTKGPNYYWVDEYPNKFQRFVLNGSIIGAYGLYEHWWVFGDERSKVLFSREMTTVKANVSLYRNPHNISYYDLLFKVMDPSYHTLHIQLLKKCYYYTGDKFFSDMSDLFLYDHS
ncbi:MAG TPA: D-glucuronyl C5-epimerase family protein [Candidatus Cloacimonadota bacterium]|nr:D-glucuronyl C5-epimerase family protein [Candidatus Cloacimonadota bacterium]HPT72411.1 D-glucuronyl C5-epimerase family protein [Candidatus Cloacimonadota bacterium]